MGLRQLAWRACYEVLGARVRQPAWTFMNYGFAPLDPTVAPLALDPERRHQRVEEGPLTRSELQV